MGFASPTAGSDRRAARQFFSCSIFGAEWIIGIPRSPTALRKIGRSSCSTMRGSPHQETPDTIDAMAEHAADFVKALGLSQVDLLGFSIGGYIAQTLTLRHPELIRRLIL